MPLFHWVREKITRILRLQIDSALGVVFLTIAVNLRIHIVDINLFSYSNINIIAGNAELGDIPLWRGYNVVKLRI